MPGRLGDAVQPASPRKAARIMSQLCRATNASRFAVLVLEADEAYRVTIGACVGLTGGRVDSVCSPELAFAALLRNSYDLLIWGLCDTEADRRVEVMGELWLRSEAPLVMIDVYSSAAQFALEAGADQWLVKPFVPGALVGIGAEKGHQFGAARRHESGIPGHESRWRLAFAGAEACLTRQEWDLFSIHSATLIASSAHREILRLGWRAGDHAADQLRTYVQRLRHKLEPLNLPCHLMSQHGRGYCLSFD
jgi:DNA-binding response OmpR family regulator